MKMLSSDDRLALYGYGVFETLRVTKCKLEVPDLHYKRMLEGAKALGLEVVAYEVWLDNILRYLETQDCGDTFSLRLTLSGGAVDNKISPEIFYHIRSIPYTLDQYQNGEKICFLSTKRNEYSYLIRIKSTNYIENILARQEAASKGAIEGIWVNSKGFLTEGSVSNIFFNVGGTLYTPSLESGCLPGTRRFIILELAKSLNIPYKEDSFEPELLKEAKEIFLTNALMGIMPIYGIDDFLIGDSFKLSNSLTNRLGSAYREYVFTNSVLLQTR
ncbi:MAG: aminotransferase class IV [Desulfitobacterium hafniense]|nr:aminotransferase class IV [Desulfitobacterium hafniense]